MKNQEFLLQKRSNFTKYLHDSLTVMSSNNKVIIDNYTEYMTNINEIENASFDDFLKYILFKIMLHIDKLNNAVDVILTENKLERKYFSKE